MITFWIATAVLCFTAFFLVYLPWMYRERVIKRANDYDAEERIRANVRVFKERLRELSADLKSDVISQDEFEGLKAELESSLLSDTEGFEQSVSAASSSEKFTPMALLFAGWLVIVAGVLLYFKWGSYDLASQHANNAFSSQEIADAQANAHNGDTRGLLVQLRDKLRTAPDNVEGWTLLARSAMNTEQFDIAIEAYDALIPREPQARSQAALWGLKAQALYFSGSEFDSTPVQNALSNSLGINPNDSNALGLTAVVAYERRDFEKAIDVWQRILQNDPQHPSRNSIEMAIESAQMELGQSPASDRPQTDESSAAKIVVRVEIDPSVRSTLSGAETLVVFARASAGPPMPLAVVRQGVPAKTTEFMLDDSMAMMPQLKLSLFEQVDLIVRITTGSVERMAGDYEVVIPKLAVQDQGNKIHEVKLTSANRVN